MRCRRAVKGTLCLIGALVFLPASSSSSADLPANLCELAEDCFRAALLPSDAPEAARFQARVERLQIVQERFPGSVWGRRAGLLIGLLLSEREPAEAGRFLRIAQRDFPILEDYIRFWRGEALLRAGDAARAALLFESIEGVDPDTLLGARAAFRAGEAWYRADDCHRAADRLGQAVAQASQDSKAPAALLMLADCQIRENRQAEGEATLRQIWVRYPSTPQAREAMARLAASTDRTAARPTPDDLFARASSFLTLSLHADAVDAFQEFLSLAPEHPSRSEARLKLGVALVRLKRYEQARQVFTGLVTERTPEAREAAVWLARVYLRQGEGERLLALQQSAAGLSLTAEQRAWMLMLAGTWLEEHDQTDQAIATYRRVVQAGDNSGWRQEAKWRIGWIQYRSGQLREAVETFQEIANGREDPQYTPQTLYWLARALERLKDSRATDSYSQLCRQYPLTYYCQLAQSRTERSVRRPMSTGSVSQRTASLPEQGRNGLGRDVHYRKAMELKILGDDGDAARELAALTERYARDRAVLLELSAQLSELGDYHHALRLARLHFREFLERGGDEVPEGLWRVAYPTGYLPRIRVHAGSQVDPYLVAAIIREESQYDPRAVSRVGALGLMQLLPATAQAVARRLGLSEVEREQLFEQDTNIRFGAAYLGQLLEQFGGNVIYAVAAYNAGPAAVSGWIQQNGERDPDEFVEMIPYQETRQYVKRVLRSYREYRRLGGGSSDARDLDKVC